MRIITLSDIKLPIGADENQLREIARKKLGRPPVHFVIRKKSLDARDKNNIRFVYTLECSDTAQPKTPLVFPRLAKDKLPKEKIVIVGSGPAGLFCALRLLDHGITPIVIERGGTVEEREEKTQKFFQERLLNLHTNIQFGEGGAGTFSDGKLNTRTHTPLNTEVLRRFTEFGAPEEILWLANPHIGSDKLKTVVKNMREYIRKQGGEVRFHTCLEDIKVRQGRVEEVVLRNTQTQETERMPVSKLVLAVGHSARDTFEMLLKNGVEMRSKDFAIGVRIEHLQKNIGLAQYGKAYANLPPAEYKLVSHASERAAFTFCMCPGGFVMPAASEEGGVVTNGMSNYARNGENANSALIAQVTRADFDSENPLAGIEFQRKIERAAYTAGGSSYAAPTQLLGDFLQDKQSKAFGEVQPTYAAGTAFADLRAVLPTGVCDTLKIAAQDMDRRLRGFNAYDAILTGAETRTSSPVRMERGENLQSVSVAELYPCGEGAGYAGGITSSAADGLRVAQAIFTQLSC